MKNETSKTSILIAILFEILLIIETILKLILKGEVKIGKTILLIVVIALPFIITKITNLKKVRLQKSFQVVMLMFIFITSYLGELKGFYELFSWWDLFIHGVFGGYGIIIGLNLIKGVIKKEDIISYKRFLKVKLIFSFNFIVTLGTLWEVFEFVGDYIFHTSMVKGGLNDTMTDIMAKIGSAFIVAIIIYWRKVKNISE